MRVDFSVISLVLYCTELYYILILILQWSAMYNHTSKKSDHRFALPLSCDRKDTTGESFNSELQLRPGPRSFSSLAQRFLANTIQITKL